MQHEPGFGHHETQAVEIDQYFKQIAAFEAFDGICEFAALTQRGDEIGARLVRSVERVVFAVHHLSRVA